MLRHEQEYRITKMAKTLAVSRSGYYAWKHDTEKRIAKRKADKALTVHIIKEFHENRRNIGSKHMARNLSQTLEQPINHKRIERLMRINGLQVKRKKPKYHNCSKITDESVICGNILNREFNPKQTKERFVSDTTYIWTKEGWLYLAAIMDLCGRKIVGFSTSNRNNKALVKEAFGDALRASAFTGREQNSSQYESQGKLLGQCTNREFLGKAKTRRHTDRTENKNRCRTNGILIYLWLLQPEKNP